MLPTFVIGLREGLEAALIVGIVAAFLRQQGRKDLLRWVFIGVGAAVLLCAGVGIVLNVVSRELPQRQQEGLETVVGIVAIAMVTYMIVWMKRHSRELKGQLEGLTAEAMTGGSRAGLAMVLMAFLAVLREGFETAVFLLAAFNESSNTTTPAIGALLGILVAVVLGYGIYRGGVRINLSKFFRVTGIVLALVAAGLVVTALHTAHEAGWLNWGQTSALNLTWLARPGTVQSSLLTGLFGVQSHPVIIEVAGWLAYLIPVGLFVGWAPGKGWPARRLGLTLLGAGAALTGTAAILAAVAPTVDPAPVTGSGAFAASVLSVRADNAVVRTTVQSPAEPQRAGEVRELTLSRAGSENRDGLPVDTYTVSIKGDGPAGHPATLTPAQIAEANGGRLPLGLIPAGTVAPAALPATYRDSNVLTVAIEPRTRTIIDLRWQQTVTVSVTSAAGAFQLAEPIAQQSSALPAEQARLAASAAVQAGTDGDRRTMLHEWAWVFGVGGVLTLLAGGAFALSARRRDEPAPAHAEVAHDLVKAAAKG